MHPLSIISAYFLDLFLGDPRWFPHPVRLVGKLILVLEKALRAISSSPVGLKVSGIFLAFLICAATLFVTTFLISGSDRISPAMGFAVSAVLAYFTLATRDLQVETRKVLQALESGELPRAREELSFLVGRDTAGLEEPEILRALVETIGENISDGVIAPFFYLGLGGAPLAMAYKAVNTLDSMVGYKNERYLHFGWASAKLDDAANFIPARLSGFIVVLSSLALGKPWRESLRILLRDHAKHDSPNSAWPESAIAGALGVRLGGLNYYFGLPNHKPFIGEPQKVLERSDVREAWKILYLSSFFMLLIALLLNWVAGKF